MSGTPDVRWTRADVRAPGLGTNTMNSTGKIATPGQNSGELVDGNHGRDRGKLDPHAATQIHGPNPTKSQLTNKSQKKFGAIFGGEFSDLGQEQQNQARKQRGGLQFCEKPRLMIPYNVDFCGDFRNWAITSKIRLEN